MRAKIAKSLRSITRHQALRCEPKHTNGKREANKLDKLDRIKRAARELFTTVGYDKSTTRQIAKKAGVALGTVFTYATTKRDLLYLVSDDLLAGARDLAAKSFRQDRSLEHNFVAFCAVFYKVIGAQPKLSKVVFRDLSFYKFGNSLGCRPGEPCPHSEEYRSSRRCRPRKGRNPSPGSAGLRCMALVQHLSGRESPLACTQAP